MLNPLFLGFLHQLTDTDEDLELMCRPMDEWTDEEIQRMCNKSKKIMGIKDE